jgi:hypothetical protein
MAKSSIEHAIVLLADGARADVIGEELAAGRLPNIARYLVGNGSDIPAVTSFPSTTGPAYLPFLRTVNTVNLRDAGAYLDAARAGSVEVYTLPDKRHLLDPRVYVPILDLYTKTSIRHHPSRDDVPSRDVINVSPLRFTWELRDPDYYSAPDEGGERPRTVAVISSSPGQALTNELKKKLRVYRKARTFGIDEGVYQSKSFVTIYEKAGQRVK